MAISADGHTRTFERNVSLLSRYWNDDPGTIAVETFEAIGNAEVMLAQLFDRAGWEYRRAIWAALAKQQLTADLRAGPLGANTWVSLPGVINGVPRPDQRCSPTQVMTTWLINHPPAVPCDTAKIELLTSMPIKRVVNQEGVRWKNLHFVSDELEALVRRVGHGVEVTMYVNVADLSKVRVADPQTGELIAAHCTWHGYANALTLPEHELLCRELRARRQKILLPELINLQRSIQAELEAARTGKKLTGAAKKAERMKQSSETIANGADNNGTPAGGVDTKPSEILISPTNQSVLDTLLI